MLRDKLKSFLASDMLMVKEALCNTFNYTVCTEINGAILLDMFKLIIRGFVCKFKYVVDVGTGSGKFIRSLVNVCKNSSQFIIGVDIDCERLYKAKDPLNEYLVDLVCSDASRSPFRNGSADLITMFLTLHEVEEDIVDSIILEAKRVLKKDSLLLFIDKYLFKASKPSEEVSLMTEEAYHKAMEYAEGIKLWGLREPKEYIGKFTQHGFKVILKKDVRGKHINGETFIKSWGRDTVRLANAIGDESRRNEVMSLVSKIRELGVKHGYGPVRLILLILKS